MIGTFNLIMADPPWHETGGCGRGTGNHYPTIKRREDILRVMVTAEHPTLGPIWRPADVAHMWMWATTTSLPDAMWLMDALGFTYKTVGVWGKTNSVGQLKIGMGQYMRHTFEPILFGVRGKGARALSPSSTSVSDWLDTIEQPVIARRRRHSQKPDEMVAKIEQVSAGADRRLEMFAREEREGWTPWGNEIAA